ncbi:uncharacterized protein LOC125659303 [Ostrea edulis]|uniref:uncharacterized protein LOC125659303 n=1 Tax=Ostrea edulis TaxID=37623 RepID=UPI0024AEC924|nr:uncharacterized protein LOC125659303 [Ostrea edulis]
MSWMSANTTSLSCHQHHQPLLSPTLPASPPPASTASPPPAATASPPPVPPTSLAAGSTSLSFHRLDGRAPEVLAPVMEYIIRTWIRSPIFEIHLVSMLYLEATDICLQMKMVSEVKMQRYQRKRTRQVEGRVFELWYQYCNRDITASQLLQRCANIYGPSAQ